MTCACDTRCFVCFICVKNMLLCVADFHKFLCYIFSKLTTVLASPLAAYLACLCCGLKRTLLVSNFYGYLSQFTKCWRGLGHPFVKGCGIWKCYRWFDLWYYITRVDKSVAGFEVSEIKFNIDKMQSYNHRLQRMSCEDKFN